MQAQSFYSRSFIRLSAHHIKSGPEWSCESEHYLMGGVDVQVRCLVRAAAVPIIRQSVCIASTPRYSQLIETTAVEHAKEQMIRPWL